MAFAGISEYVKSHERLLIVVLVLAVGMWVSGKGLNIVQNYEQGKLNNLEQQLQLTQQQSAAAQQAGVEAKNAATAVATEAAQDKAASAALISALSIQNATLSAQIANRGKETQQQQQQDLTAQIPELGKRFAALVPNINTTDVKVAPDASSVTIGRDTAEKTVSQLELVPLLQADEKDLQGQMKNGETMLASSQKALESETKYADSAMGYATVEEKYAGLLEKQVGQADNVCKEKLAIEKTNTKKAFLKGFKLGSVFGFLSGLFVGHAIF